MTTVVLTGDRVTTTAVVLAAGWAEVHRAAGGSSGAVPEASSSIPPSLIVECDASGGSLIAWTGLRGDRTLSAAVVAFGPDSSAPDIGGYLQPIGEGVAVLAGPVRSVEAVAALAQADRWLAPALRALPAMVMIDTGRPAGARATPPLAAHADLLVVVHHQRPGAAAAAAGRVEQLAERIDALEAMGHRPALVVVGDVPFAPSEIAEHLGADRLAAAAHLPDDPYTAEVVAGCAGCSARRLSRRPLMRAARTAAALVLGPLAVATPGARSGTGIHRASAVVAG